MTPLRARSPRRLCQMASWIGGREFRAWKAATLATSDEQSRRLRNRSDRLNRLAQLCWECPRKVTS